MNYYLTMLCYFNIFKSFFIKNVAIILAMEQLISNKIALKKYVFVFLIFFLAVLTII